jgi:hypothetical protein
MSTEAGRITINTQVDTEEIQTTRSEKLLAFVLTIFLLIGGLWIYFKLDDVPASPHYVGQPQRQADQGLIARRDDLKHAVNVAIGRERTARRNLELKREAYRTALDAGRPAAALQLSYEHAQSRYAAAVNRRKAAQARLSALQPEAAAAQRRVDAAYAEGNRRYSEQTNHHDRNTFLLRLAYVIATAGGAFWVLGRVRRRHPRYLAPALALVGFAAAQALVMAGDYGYDYVDFREAGLLTISLAGIAMTFAAFVALQRYLAKRIPMRRVRRRECPFCAFPVGDNERCEGCGRSVFAECSTCSSRRRVGTAHCGTCGAA